MEVLNVLQSRLKDLVNTSKQLSIANSEDKATNDRLISEIKSSGDSPEETTKNRERIAEMRKVNTYAFMRNNELNINIRLLNEIYSVLLVSGEEIDIPTEDKEVLDFNLKNVKPTFIVDQNKLIFFNPDVEEMTTKKIMELSPEEADSYIKNVKQSNG